MELAIRRPCILSDHSAIKLAHRPLAHSVHQVEESDIGLWLQRKFFFRQRFGRLIDRYPRDGSVRTFSLGAGPRARLPAPARSIETKPRSLPDHGIARDFCAKCIVDVQRNIRIG